MQPSKPNTNMSTSHYSRRDYDDIVSPSRTDQYPDAWADHHPRLRPSIQHSRPESKDVGSETIRLPLPLEKSKPPLKRAWLLATGILLLLADGCGLAYFCDSFWEALIFCCLTMPTCGFVLWCAWEIYSLNEHEDWTH